MLVAEAPSSEAQPSIVVPAVIPVPCASLRLPDPPARDPVLSDWAKAVADAAAQCVAKLEARIAYLESQVATDELTGIFNRRGFVDAFVRANAAARRGGSHGVVILCDLDGLKTINDCFGHAYGDQMLRDTAALLRRNTRRMDAVARLGGDEFALLLISASLSGARRKCQHLTRALLEIGVNASFGLAGFNGEEDEETVLHRADQAMYQQKRRRAINHRLAPKPPEAERVSPSA